MYVVDEILMVRACSEQILVCYKLAMATEYHFIESH